MEYFDEQSQLLLETQGYVILEDVLSEKDVEFIRGIVLKLASWERQQGEASLYGDNKHQRIWNLVNKDEVFRKTIQHPLIMQVMQYLFGAGVILSSWTVNIIGGEGGEGGLHTDTHVPEPLPAFPMKANSIWLLDDFTVNNGATICLPGSHLFLRHPKPEDEHRSDLIKIIAPKGAVVVTHGALWHKSGHNQTSQERIVMLGSFCPPFMRPQEDHLQIIDDEVIAEASPLLKQLLGVGYGIHEGALLKPPRSLDFNIEETGWENG